MKRPREKRPRRPAPEPPAEEPVRDRPLSVVIPCYNEVATIRTVLQRVAEEPLVGELIVVDDCSTDGTRECITAVREEWPTSRPPLRAIFLPRNRGKGAALRAGFAQVRGPIAIVQDGDLEYDPREYSKLVRPILDGDADVVYGSRFEGTPRRVLNFWHSIGNRLLTMLSNVTTNLNLTDMETCYKVFKSDIIKAIPIRSDRFGFEPEVTAKVAKLGCRVYEVPISYRGRSVAEGKKITWVDGLKAIGVILKYAVVNDLGLDRGHMVLKVMERAGEYNRWLGELIRPHLGKDVLEIGSGIGNMARFLAGPGRLTVSDRSDIYLTELGRAFGRREDVKVRRLDITGNSYPQGELYDTVVCLNVLEHIEDDVEALRNMRALLRPGGKAILLVPANPRLYCAIDAGVGHFRRYRLEELTGRMKEAGFRITLARHHNPIGALGWWFSGKVLRKKSLTGGEMRGFNLLMPLVRLQDRFQTRVALSVLAVGEKAQASGVGQ